MKKFSLVASCLAAAGLSGRGQPAEPLTPPEVAPRPVERPVVPRPSERPRSPRPNPAGDSALIADKPNLALTGIIIVKSRAEIQPSAAPPPGGLEVRDIPFLNTPEFREVVQPFLGKLLTENLLRDLQDQIILYCRERGKLLVDMILVPEQNIENGVIQLWFLEGKVGKIGVKNEGRKWFSDEFIARGVRLHPGDPLDSHKLSDDLDWLNNNPFRQVDVNFRPGEGLGMTDLELQVQDRFPIRPYFGYENTGTRFTGEDRLIAGFNWGNAFWLDHQLNYQYSTDVDFDLVKAHSASYLAPLPWRHNLVLFGSYVDGKADFSSIDSTTTSEAESWQASGRYSIPMRHFKDYRHEASVGFDFKRSNNDLLAGGRTVLQTSDTDIAQFAAGYSGLLPDKFGQSSFGLELYYSPGDLTDHNNDKDFGDPEQGLRTDARADYFYGRLNAERITRLPYDFSWVLRGWGQIASERLLPSEELAIGGFNTVRGYDERVVIGDNGIIINTEIRTPPLVLGNSLGVPGGRDELQFLGFFDFGSVEVIDAVDADGEDPDRTLCSVGAGLRWTVSRNFSVRFDYGFALREEELNENERSGRGHIGLLLSF